MLSTIILPSLIVIVKGSVGIWTKLVEKLLTEGQKLASSLRLDLDEEFVVERNYRKTLFKNTHT